MGIDKRIVTLIEILGLTPGEFADKINVQRSSISHITSARNKPSLDFLERTLSVFPEINSEWLILGKGKPLKSQFEKHDKSTINQKQESPLLFPMDEVEQLKSLKNDNLNGDTTAENSAKPNYSTVDTLTQKIISSNSVIKKKGIKKILILYDDHSFEVFEN